jgi:Domain of unknown function (DUF4145)
MAILVTNCPHCRAEQMTFDVFAPVKYRPDYPIGRQWAVAAGAECRGCGKPIALLFGQGGEPDWQRIVSAIQGSLGLEVDITTRGLGVIEQWPKAVSLSAPNHLPASVEKAFLQGEGNFGRPGFEEAAALMYRRALELALKEAYPEQTGSLAQIIRKLVADHRLPAVMGDWLTEIRLIGNDGAHEIDGVTNADLAAARGFVETALRYIFTLPAEIAARRGQPAAVA